MIILGNLNINDIRKLVSYILLLRIIIIRLDTHNFFPSGSYPIKILFAFSKYFFLYYKQQSHVFVSSFLFIINTFLNYLIFYLQPTVFFNFISTVLPMRMRSAAPQTALWTGRAGKRTRDGIEAGTRRPHPPPFFLIRMCTGNRSECLIIFNPDPEHTYIEQRLLAVPPPYTCKMIACSWWTCRHCPLDQRLQRPHQQKSPASA